MGTRRVQSAVLLLSAALTLAAGPSVKRDGDMYVAETRHYRVRCDIGPEATVEIARTMEALGTAYYRILRRFGGGKFGRLDVIVFRDRADYAEVVGPQNANTAGVYRVSTRTTYASPGGIDVGGVTDVLRHEGFHQFADHYLGGNLPVWLNEGLAEYFRHGWLRGDRLVTGEAAASPIARVQAAIRAERTVPLGRLVTWSLAEWNETRRADAVAGALAYDEAYLFTHFLMEANRQRYRGLVGRYLERVNRGVDGTRAFRGVFGDNVEAIERKWHAYVLALEPSTRHLCRARLETIGARLLRYGGGKRYTVKGFCEAVDSGEMGPDISSAGLMHCPDDNRSAKLPSYRFDDADGAPLPRVSCIHHKGFQLVMTFKKDAATGQWEAIVREAPK